MMLLRKGGSLFIYFQIRLKGRTNEAGRKDSVSPGPLWLVRRIA